MATSYPGVPSDIFNRIAEEQRRAGRARYEASPSLQLDDERRLAADEGPCKVLPSGETPFFYNFFSAGGFPPPVLPLVSPLY